MIVGAASCGRLFNYEYYMVFSSFIFLSVFMPVVLLVYALLRKTILQNYFLLAASLFFYWWGEPAHLWVMLLSIIFTHVGGQLLNKVQSVFTRKTIAAIFIGLNLSLLAYFKYAMFLTDIWGNVFAHGHWQNPLNIILPIGISFYVFQGVSYIIDVYKRQCLAQSNIFNTGLYISMFPQLIAGPIVRYQSISSALSQRSVSLQGYVSGLTRFCFGLAKKVLLANPAGQIADSIFALPTNELTLPIAWLGALAYTAQIYFDFSGYSDMAIGIGRALGFRFPENFNYPYVAKSVTDFWRRWHMSLTSWFKDYVYIPLGGNRKGLLRTNINLFTVFMFTGFWHGANWTFIAWGIWHGAFLILEKYLLATVKIKIPTLIKWLYCFLVVVFGWVLFRSDSISDALGYIGTMLNFNRANLDMFFLSYMNVHTALLFAVIIPVAAGLLKFIPNKAGLSQVAAIILLAASYIMLVISTYNPFIYFRF